MKLVFELSKEHPCAPQHEIIACLQANNSAFTMVQQTPEYSIVDAELCFDAVQQLADRLAFTYCISRYITSCPPEPQHIKKHLKEHTQNYTGSIAVTYKKRTQQRDTQLLLQAAADTLVSTQQVNLQHPDHEIRLLITNTNIVIGEVLHHINRTHFEQRKVQHRPFFSPISLHPKWARLLVNLSQASAGQTLLDPFCGTGGFLLEAGLLGIQVLGSDIQEKMIQGCAKTLQHYHITPTKLLCSDIGALPEKLGQIDAIVTDFPYGRSTTTQGESLDSLASRAFQSMKTLVKPQGRIVIGLHDPSLLETAKKFFDVELVLEQPVHRSLTRWFAVLINKP